MPIIKPQKSSTPVTNFMFKEGSDLISKLKEFSPIPRALGRGFGRPKAFYLSTCVYESKRTKEIDFD